MTILVCNPQGHKFILSSEMNLQASLISFRAMYAKDIRNIDNVVNFIQWKMKGDTSPLSEFNLIDLMHATRWTFRITQQSLGIVNI